MPFARMPGLSVTEHSRFYMKFHISETDVSMANAIRRTMIAEVPTMAIDMVTVKENTSALADEYIVHRLGLIPLLSENIDDFEMAHDCDECDDYCEKCSVKFKLNKDGGSESDVVKVTSKDLIVANEEHHSHCHKVQPVHDSGDERRPDEDDGVDGILIARLTRGQKIEMEAIARKCMGKAHAKWSPMCTVAYRIVPPAVELELEKLNAVLSIENKKDLLEASHGLLRLDETTGMLEYESPFLLGRIQIHPDVITRAGELAMKDGGKAHEIVRYNPEPKRFDFTAETTGALTPVDVLRRALGLLSKKVEVVQSFVR